MRTFLLALGAVLFCSAPAMAQSATPTVAPASEARVTTPEVEVFGGYSYLRQYGENLNGGHGQVTYNVNDWFGVTGDFAGYAGTDGADSSGLVLVGPKFTYRRGPVTPFAEFLFGGAFGGSDGAGAMALGGGVDAKVSKHIAIRIFQADYVATTFRSNNGRISCGIVFRFGERE